MAKLVIVSHKPCWPAHDSPTGYATDGGFPFQVSFISEIFDETVVLVPCSAPANRPGSINLEGDRLKVVPLSMPAGSGNTRRLGMIFWLFRNIGPLIKEIYRSDAVHTPIPGDVGTVGMLLALLLRKPLFVRHCGNWSVQRTTAERFWKFFMEKFAGGEHVMLATGGSDSAPSAGNPNIRWIFSTSLTRAEIESSCRRRVNPPLVPRLITISRLEKSKRADVVLQCLPHLLEDFPGLTLDIVGTGSARDELQLLAGRLGIGEHVVFHGQVDHDKVIDLLKQADLFCFPTTSEGFPKVVVEALACGLPVITTRVSVLPKLIETGCGILLDEATPETLANAVRKCLGDADSYREMSDQAIRTAQQYSLENWRDTIRDMLETAWGRLRSDARPG